MLPVFIPEGGRNMIVTEIKQNKNDKTKYSVFVDGQFVFSLVMADILYFHIKVGEEIPEQTFRFISRELLYEKAQKKALSYLGSLKRTEWDVRKKLESEGYTEEVCQRVMDFLKEYRYVDDLDYASSFIQDRLRFNPKSKYGMKQELRQKGVCDEVIDQALEQADIDEVQYAKELLAKKISGQGELSDKEKKKAFDFLLRRGYSYGIIKDAFYALREEE